MGKSVVKNVGFNVLNRALNVAFPIITSIYISRKLGAQGIGAVASAQNLVTYFTFIASLGIPTYGIRAIAKAKSNQGDCNKVFTELYVINFLATTLTLLAYIVIVCALDFKTGFNALHLAFISLIILNYFNIEWLYQGFENYKYIAVRSFVMKAIAFAAMIIFVRKGTDVLPYALCICLGTAGNNLLNMTQMNKYVHLDFKNLSLKRHMKAIFTLFASTIAVELYSLLDTTMLTYMSDLKHVGYYSNAVKIVKMAASMITAISSVLLPRLSTYYQEKNGGAIAKTMTNFFGMIFTLCIPCCVGIFLAADTITLSLFGNDFAPSAETIRILAALTIFMPLSALFSQIVLAVGKESEYLKSVSMGTIANAILNALFIGRFQQNGAAAASVVTELAILVTMYLAANKILSIKYINKDSIGVCIATVFMGVSIILVKKCTANIFVGAALVIEVCTGVISYGICLLILRNHLMMQLVETLFKKKLPQKLFKK